MAVISMKMKNLSVSLFLKTHLYHRTSQSTGLIMISFFSKLMYLSLNKEFMYFVLNNVSNLVSGFSQKITMI